MLQWKRFKENDSTHFWGFPAPPGKQFITQNGEGGDVSSSCVIPCVNLTKDCIIRSFI